MPVVYAFGPFRLDIQASMLCWGTDPIALGRRAAILLRVLIERPGALVSKDELIAAAWPGLAIEDSNLTVQIAALRRALGGEPGGERWIETLPRRGYRFVGPVVAREEHDAIIERQPAAPPTMAPAPPAPPIRLNRNPLPATLMLAAAALSGAVWLVAARGDHALLSTKAGNAAPSSTSGLVIPIAVLPFTSSFGAPTPGLAERIADDLAVHLPRTGAFSVVPSQGSSAPTLDLKRIGAKLGVRYIVHGTISARDEMLRISVLLIDARSGAQAWAYERTEDRGQWASIHDEFIKRTTFAIHFQALRREGNEPADPAREPTIDELLARGRAALLDGPDSPRFEEARALFSEVLHRDPQSVHAMVGLAGYYLQAVSDLKIDREPYLTEAEELLRRALARTTQHFGVHYQFSILHNLRANFTASLEASDRVLEINPSHAPSYARKGRILIRLQRYEEALKNIRYAMRLNGGTIVPGWQMWAGWAELELGHDEEARQAFNSALAALPRSPYLQASLAALHALSGEREAARQHIAEARRRTPQLSDEQRLIEFNKGPDDRALRNRLDQGLRLAIEMARDSSDQ